MDLNGVPFFALMRERMGWLDRRQQVIAENVANADTPGFVARDMQPFASALARHSRLTPPSVGGGLSATGPVPLAQTDAQHIAITTSAPSPFQARAVGDTETTLNGNRVVLEDEMVRMSETRMNYDAAVGFYQRALGMLRTAARAPGR